MLLRSFYNEEGAKSFDEAFVRAGTCPVYNRNCIVSSKNYSVYHLFSILFSLMVFNTKTRLEIVNPEAALLEDISLRKIIVEELMNICETLLTPVIYFSSVDHIDL